MSTILYEIQRADGTEVGSFYMETIERMLEAGMLETGELFRKKGESAWKPLMLLDEEKTAHSPSAKKLPLPPVKITPIFKNHTQHPPSPPKAPAVRMAYEGDDEGSSSQRWWIKGAAALLIAVIGIGAWALKDRTGRDVDPFQASDATATSEPEISPTTKFERAAKPEPTVGGGIVEVPTKPRAGVAFQAKAEAGDAEAQALLADALFFNDPTNEELSEAANWAEKSAAQENVLGKMILSHMILYGKGLPHDLENGLARNRRIAQLLVDEAEARNDTIRQRWVAMRPGFRSDDVRFNYNFLKLAADAGDQIATVILAEKTHYWDPAERQRDAFRRIRELSKSDYPPAMHHLGRMLNGGIGTDPVRTEAIEWLEKAANAGHGASWVELAKIHHAASDITKVKECLANALEDSNLILGKEVFRELRKGEALPQDDDLADAWLASLPAYAKAEVLSETISDLLDPDKGFIDPVAADRYYAKLSPLKPVPPGTLRDLIGAARGLGLGSKSSSPPIPSNPTEAMRWYKRAAEMGSYKAMHSLGSNYAEGYLVSVDKAEAKLWYQKAVATRNIGSMWYYGCFLRGEKDFAAAVSWFQKGAEAGMKYCYTDLADALATGQGIEMDHAAATKWYRKRVETAEFARTDFVAVAILCRRLKRQLGVESEPGELAKWEAWIKEEFKPKKRKSRIWNNISIAETFGSGKPNEDKAEALYWWKRAAADGNNRAMSIVAYRVGKGSSKADKNYAANLQRKLSEAGDDQAMFNLAQRYDKGDGVKKDQNEATKWFLKAANKGHHLALSEMGSRYQFGKGVPKDKNLAIQWFKKAADGGDSWAMTSLGMIYVGDDKAERNGPEALKWYEMAALRGEQFALVNIGGMYMWGMGVPIDYIKGYAWSNVAAAKCTYEAARKKALFNLATADGKLNAEQIVQAQAISRTIIKRIDDHAKGIWAEIERARRDPIPVRKSGTAWAVTADGYLITCQHVVSGATAIQVRTPDGKRLGARVLKTDPINDLALLKIEALTSPLPLNQSPDVGQKVATLGFPNTGLQGVEAKLTEGSISSLSGIRDDPSSMQVSVPVQPGNSGGPLFDMSGAVVGIITSKLSDAAGLQSSGSLPQTVNYAIKISKADRMLAGLKISPSGTANKLGLSRLARQVRKSVYLLEVTAPFHPRAHRAADSEGQ